MAELNESTHAVRGVDNAISRCRRRNLQGRNHGTCWNGVDNYDKSIDNAEHHSFSDCYNLQVSTRGGSRNSGDYDFKPRSPSPSSVAQVFRTGTRVRRNKSRTEPAQVSRPEPLREGTSAASNLKKDYHHHTRPSTSPPITATTGSTSSTAYIEIEPGVKAPLRRTEETLKAISRGAFVTMTCYGCETHLYCINDAKYMVCPHCRVVSPVSFDEEGHFGVGLGFTHETLVTTTQAQRQRNQLSRWGRAA